MPVYIYGLRCPIAGVIRYVGKSINPRARLRGHLCAARRGSYAHHTSRWLRTLIAQGLVPALEILHEVGVNERWQDIERALIADAEARGWRLTNSTAGGEGLDFLDPEDDARYRANLSRTNKALWAKPERRAEARARVLAAWADREIRERRIGSMIRAQNCAEVKAKLRVSKLEVAQRPEVKNRKSAVSSRMWADPAYRDRKLTHLQSPEFAAAQSARLRARWADPEQRARVNDARWTDEKRAEQAERARARNTRPADPEMVARRNAAIKAAWARRKAEVETDA